MKKNLLFLLLFESLFAWSQNGKTDGHLQKGNEFYRKEEYSKAAAEYQLALQLDPKNEKALFNQANALYQQQQKVDAAKILTSMLAGTQKKETLARGYYNKGVILSDEKNLQESMEAYKNTLRNDPTDKDARENLQKAILELKRKPPPPKKEEKKDNKKQQQQQQKQPQSKLNPKETQQRLQLLQQKEKQVQERIQREKNKGMGGSNNKDW